MELTTWRKVEKQQEKKETAETVSTTTPDSEQSPLEFWAAKVFLLLTVKRKGDQPGAEKQNPD